MAAPADIGRDIEDVKAKIVSTEADIASLKLLDVSHPRLPGLELQLAELRREKNLLLERSQAHVPQPGTLGDLGMLADLVSDRVAQKLEPTHRGLQAEVRSWHSSQTVEASKVKASDMDVVRRLLKVAFQGDPAVDVTTVLHPEAAAESDFQWDNTPEPSQRTRYMDQLDEHLNLQNRNLFWTHQVTAKHLLLRGLGMQITARSDELIALRLFRNDPAVGCLVGVELKKRLSHASRRQGEAELYTFGLTSNFPFVQVVTDMKYGGFAYWKSGEQQGRQVVHEKVLVGMGQVYAFLQQVITGLPSNLGEEVNHRIVMPELVEVEGGFSFMKVQDPVINAIKVPLLSIVDGDTGNDALPDLRPWFDQGEHLLPGLVDAQSLHVTPSYIR